MKKIAIVTTLWSSINNWVKPFLNEYYKNGIDVTLITNMDKDYETRLKEEFPFVHTYPIGFPRGINVLGSLKSIRVLKAYFRKNRFDLIQYSTPNASFYASIASKSAKIPVRIYCQWGMVYVTMSGFKRKVFRFIEKQTCRNSTVIQPDSKGNRDFCIREKLYSAEKSEVIWNGSAKGVDLSVFDVSKKAEYAKEIRRKYSIQDDSVVIGFVGRLGVEKGCHELFAAFKRLNEENKKCKLLFVGPIEKTETIDPEWLEYFYKNDDIIKTDRVPDVQKYVSAMDVFVLPTYREGFGMSVIEASAMGVPVVATKYPGPSSAMIDGVTGISVEVRDELSLYEAIKTILSDKEFAGQLGENGVRFVKENFDRSVFMEKLIENRKGLLGIRDV